ncbi:hypothetical protein SMCF_1546 [Streptomyces coelicoflavus ZG0656]|nr:hypothetical protein SMCF_1546 [Streptomyces coelicoflavus ZG0656]
MDNQPSPTPKAMLPRPPSLRPPGTVKSARYAIATHLPKMHTPVDMAWGDTGTLCSLGQRPHLLEQVMRLYGTSLVVTEAVSREIYSKANKPERLRTPENRIMCISAKKVADKLDSGDIRVLPLVDSPSVKDKHDIVMQQLRDLDASRRAAHGPSDDEDYAHKHAGEADSIVAAVRTIALKKRTVFLTNDGGASLVAQRHGVASRHVGHLLAELGCADSSITPEELYEQFMQMTGHFATVPNTARPASSDFFVCSRADGVCNACDALAPA